MRKKIEEFEKFGEWEEELPRVMWSLRTTKKEASRRTHFSLVFGIEVVLRIEVIIQSLQLTNWEPEGNIVNLKTNLNLLEEERVKAAWHVDEYQIQIVHYYNRNVQSHNLQVCDLVL